MEVHLTKSLRLRIHKDLHDTQPNDMWAYVDIQYCINKCAYAVRVHKFNV